MKSKRNLFYVRKMAIAIPDVIDSIGIHEYINAFLVDKGVRPAMMLQPSEYEERTEADPKTSEIIRNILSTFPSLKPSLTETHEIILSKRDVKLEDIETHKQLGTVLGYPCASEFQEAKLIADIEPTYAIHLYIKLKDAVQTEEKEIQLFANVCLTPVKQPIFEEMARAAEAAIHADPILSLLVDSVYVQVHTIIPPRAIVDKLIRAQPLTADELEEFHNLSENIGFTKEGLVDYPFDFTKGLHRGIGIFMMSLYMHDPTSPFYPLQMYPGKDTEVAKESADLDMELRKALDSADLVLEGGGRRRRPTHTRRAKKN
jgi:hypothetical protein